MEGKRTPNFSANLDKKPGFGKVQQHKGLYEVPRLLGTSRAHDMHRLRAEEVGSGFAESALSTTTDADAPSVKAQQTKLPPQRYCTTHTLFRGFPRTCAFSHQSTVQMMAPTKRISTPLLLSTLIPQGKRILTVTRRFNTQDHWLCFQTPKGLQTRLMPSLQICNAVHIPFSSLLPSKLQRQTKIHIMVLPGQYILQRVEVPPRPGDFSTALYHVSKRDPSPCWNKVTRRHPRHFSSLLNLPFSFLQ